MSTFTENVEESIKNFSKMAESVRSGIENMMSMEEIRIATAEREEVYTDGKMTLYHYKPLKKSICPVPLLVTYALVNRPTMLDLQEDKSLIRNLLKEGMDIYLIDWGYPDRSDRYLTLEDYIDGYIGDAVDFIRKRHKLEKINMLGICQGGTFSCVYAALNPDRVQNLIATVTPIEFDINDGLLNVWSRSFDVDLMVDALGNVPGESMNQAYNMLIPFSLTVQKYIDMVDVFTDREKLTNFLRMEKWIFDSPDQAGEAFRQFIKEFYQKNSLVKGTFVLGGRQVKLSSIDMPLMVVYGEYDHLVPPSSTKPLYDLVSSKEKKILGYPVGHIGLYVSGKTQKTLAPTIAKWIKDHI